MTFLILFINAYLFIKSFFFKYSSGLMLTHTSQSMSIMGHLTSGPDLHYEHWINMSVW